MTTASDFSAELAPESPVPSQSNFAMTWVDYFRPVTFAFWAVHLAAIAGVAYVGFSWRGLALAVGVYFVRMVVVTAAYHRYFSHRAFKTSRCVPVRAGAGAQSAAQKGVIWWASHHRWHHKLLRHASRTSHSARLRGFWYSHIGWMLSRDWNATDESRVTDLAASPSCAS